MKKLIFAISLAISFILSSCTSPADRRAIHRAEDEVLSIKGSHPSFRGIYNFEYKNHNYIAFDDKFTEGGFAVVHDPDCPCHKND